NAAASPAVFLGKVGLIFVVIFFFFFCSLLFALVCLFKLRCRVVLFFFCLFFYRGLFCDVSVHFIAAFSKASTGFACVNVRNRWHFIIGTFCRGTLWHDKLLALASLF